MDKTEVLPTVQSYAG